MHTFFSSLENPSSTGMTPKGHSDLLAVWEKSWQSFGWSTKVLTEEDAELHPDFEAIDKKLQQLEVNEYNRFCFWRWDKSKLSVDGWLRWCVNFCELKAELYVVADWADLRPFVNFCELTASCLLMADWADLLIFVSSGERSFVADWAGLFMVMFVHISCHNVHLFFSYHNLKLN